MPRYYRQPFSRQCARRWSWQGVGLQPTLGVETTGNISTATLDKGNVGGTGNGGMPEERSCKRSAVSADG
jgi:hypothetical protein